MENFWGSETWGLILILAMLFFGLMLGNMLKRSVPFLKKSLVPTSVLGGGILLLVASVYEIITGEVFFDIELFAGKGISVLETITYHALALGFVASTLKRSERKFNKKRSEEIFNTGVTTVGTYLLQGVVGFVTTIIIACFIDDFFAAAGVLLPFGFGQGTGQAMNYGNIYETEFGFSGGKSFGLTIAAMGFLCASFGGVIYLNVMKKRGRLKTYGQSEKSEKISSEQIQALGEIPMQESIDKLTIQVAMIFVSYALAYIFMFILGLLIPGMKSTIYGFNFILGVLAATIVKEVNSFFHKKDIIHRQYLNNFLLTRTSNFFFDIMVVAGIAAIRFSMLEKYWGILLILSFVGFVFTYAYNRIVAKFLFSEYKMEQFLAMFGMLTGTASTGIILLREIDGDFKTPAADNLVYQNFPAIALGFPIMLLATLAPQKPMLTIGIFLILFAVMNIILFRKFIFRKKKKS